jgi:hypothetical protein
MTSISYDASAYCFINDSLYLPSGLEYQGTRKTAGATNPKR